MCIQVVERYAECRCLCYKHPVDGCSSYRGRGHYVRVQEILVGYACPKHSSSSVYQQARPDAGPQAQDISRNEDPVELGAKECDPADTIPLRWEFSSKESFDLQSSSHESVPSLSAGTDTDSSRSFRSLKRSSALCFPNSRNSRLSHDYRTSPRVSHWSGNTTIRPLEGIQPTSNPHEIPALDEEIGVGSDEPLHTVNQPKPKDGRYRCPYTSCNKAFSQLSDVTRHTSKHGQRLEQNLRCPITGCDRDRENGFERNDELRSHLVLFHKFEIPDNMLLEEVPELQYQVDTLFTRDFGLFLKNESTLPYPGHSELSRSLDEPLSETTNLLASTVPAKSVPSDEYASSSNGHQDVPSGELGITPPCRLLDDNEASGAYTNADQPGFRVEWDCHCGFASFDDFITLQPDAITDYQTILQNCLTIRTITPSLQRSHSNVLEGRPFFGAISDFITTLLQKRRSILPHSNIEIQPMSPLDSIQPSIPPVSANLQPLYLLLCIPHQRYATKLLQLDLTGLKSDRNFFKVLQDGYQNMRGRWRRKLSLKSLQGIKFVQFELHQPDLVDVQQESLPPEARKDEYHYSPMPPKNMPPIGENLMIHYYTSPDCATERGIVLDRIPKKLRERLRTCPNKGTGEGWGIYFLEGWHVGIITISAFTILLLGSLVFLICWSVLKHDVQGASGIAMYIMAFVALGVGSLQAAFEL